MGIYSCIRTVFKINIMVFCEVCFSLKLILQQDINIFFCALLLARILVFVDAVSKVFLHCLYQSIVGVKDFGNKK